MSSWIDSTMRSDQDDFCYDEPTTQLSDPWYQKVSKIIFVITIILIMVIYAPFYILGELIKAIIAFFRK